MVSSRDHGAFAWLILDLDGPCSSRLLGFDPGEGARLEIAMWRSYYAKERVRLFAQLGELMPNVVAYHSVKAAFRLRFQGRKVSCRLRESFAEPRSFLHRYSQGQ
jgi:hypothetical protein